MKTVACITTRTSSTRLPLKALRDCGYGYSMLELLIKRLKAVSSLDKIYICTSTDPMDDIMEDISKREGIDIFRGSLENVIERITGVNKLENADVLLRITGDNPFTSTEYIDQQIKILVEKELDYVKLVDAPLGANADVFTSRALEKCQELMDPAISEYMMLYLYDPTYFRIGTLKPFPENYDDFSLTVDFNDDLIRLRKTTEHFSEYSSSPEKILLSEILKFYSENPQLPNLIFSQGGDVKLPYGKSLPYDDFKKDMEKRRLKTLQINLFE